MNKSMKQIMAAALAVATLGAGTTTQVQAGSDFGRTLLGVAAVGIIIHEVKKDRAHKSRSYKGHEVRSHQRKRFHSGHRGNHRSFSRSHNRHHHNGHRYN